MLSTFADSPTANAIVPDGRTPPKSAASAGRKPLLVTAKLAATALVRSPDRVTVKLKSDHPADRSTSRSEERVEPGIAVERVGSMTTTQLS